MTSCRLALEWHRHHRAHGHVTSGVTQAESTDEEVA